MQTYLLKENTLSDDVLLLADDGKIFAGGYFAIVEFFTYANAWSDKKHIQKFRSQKSLEQFLKKNYKDFDY